MRALDKLVIFHFALLSTCILFRPPHENPEYNNLGVSISKRPTSGPASTVVSFAAGGRGHHGGYMVRREREKSFFFSFFKKTSTFSKATAVPIAIPVANFSFASSSSSSSVSAMSSQAVRFLGHTTDHITLYILHCDEGFLKEIPRTFPGCSREARLSHNPQRFFSLSFSIITNPPPPLASGTSTSV